MPVVTIKNIGSNYVGSMPGYPDGILSIRSGDQIGVEQDVADRLCTQFPNQFVRVAEHGPDSSRGRLENEGAADDRSAKTGGAPDLASTQSPVRGKKREWGGKR